MACKPQDVIRIDPGIYHEGFEQLCSHIENRIDAKLIGDGFIRDAGTESMFNKASYLEAYPFNTVLYDVNEYLTKRYTAAGWEVVRIVYTSSYRSDKYGYSVIIGMRNQFSLYVRCTTWCKLLWDKVANKRR